MVAAALPAHEAPALWAPPRGGARPAGLPRPAEGGSGAKSRLGREPAALLRGGFAVAVTVAEVRGMALGTAANASVCRAERQGGEQQPVEVAASRRVCEESLRRAAQLSRRAACGVFALCLTPAPSV